MPRECKGRVGGPECCFGKGRTKAQPKPGRIRCGLCDPEILLTQLETNGGISQLRQRLRMMTDVPRGEALKLIPEAYINEFAEFRALPLPQGNKADASAGDALKRSAGAAAPRVLHRQAALGGEDVKTSGEKSRRGGKRDRRNTSCLNRPAPAEDAHAADVSDGDGDINEFGDAPLTCFRSYAMEACLVHGGCQQHQAFWKTQMLTSGRSNRHVHDPALVDDDPSEAESYHTISTAGEVSDDGRFFAIQQVEEEVTEDLIRKYIATVELDVKVVDGDGHCLFRSASLQTDKGEDNHAGLRRDVVKHVQMHVQMYEGFFSGVDTNAAIRLWARKMGSMAWGDDKAVHAIAEFLHRPVVIFRAHRRQEPTVICPAGFRVLPSTMKGLRPIFLRLDESQRGCEHTMHSSLAARWQLVAESMTRPTTLSARRLQMILDSFQRIMMQRKMVSSISCSEQTTEKKQLHLPE